MLRYFLAGMAVGFTILWTIHALRKMNNHSSIYAMMRKKGAGE